MTLTGIEPASFRFVAQHLIHCATVVSFIFKLHNFEDVETHIIFHFMVQLTRY